MLQLAYFAGDAVRINGAGNERSADFLWLLATVIASDHAALTDVLGAFIDRHIEHPAVRERLEGAKTYLDDITARVDPILAVRWSEAKEELRCLTDRTDASAAKSSHDFQEFTELEALREKRSDVVKSLIKISDSIQLIEASLLDRLTSDPVKLRDRNFRNAEETKAIARQELEKLRLLIARISAISRRGFTDSGTHFSQQRQRPKELLAGKTSDGVAIADLSIAELHAKMCGSLRKAAAALREFKIKIEGARRRPLNNDLQHALNVLQEKTRKAMETCDGLDPGTGDASRTTQAADVVLPLLRDVMTAQTSIGARVNTTKLNPAEKQPLTALLYAMRLRLGEDHRDLERLRAEIVERSAGVETEPHGGEALPPDATAGTKVVAMITELAAGANNTLKPVKALLIGLNDAFAADFSDNRALQTAAAALLGGITEAQDVMTANFERIRTLAADFAVPADEVLKKFGRWQAQLAALEAETARLLQSIARVAAMHEAVTAVTVLEQGIADALKPPPGARIRSEPFVPVRRRCDDALATLAVRLRESQEARDFLTAARDAPWRMLPTASRCVGRLWSDLAATEKALHDSRARIEAIHNHFKTDRPRPH